jgi:hypothetical protein
MGFFDSLFRRKEESKAEVLPEKKEDAFSIEDAEKYLSDKFEEAFSPFRDDAERIYYEIQSAVKILEGSLDELGKSKFADRVDPELLQNVESHKSSFIHKMELMIKVLNSPMNPDFDSIIGYGNSISTAIFEANQRTLNDYRFVDRLFEKEGDKVINNFKSIDALSKRLRDFTNSRKDALLSIMNIQNMLRSMSEDKISLGQIDEDLKVLEDNKNELKFAHDIELKNLRKFDESEGWLNFTGLSEKRESMEREIYNIRLQINESISKIEGPMRRLKSLVEKGVIKFDDEKMLDNYIDSFFDAMMQEKNTKTIKSILKAIQDNISEDKIGLKEKSISEIKWILENEVFENLLDRYISLEESLKNIEGDLKKMDETERRSEIDSRIKEFERQIELKSQDIEKAKKQIEKIQKSVDDKRIELEKSLTTIAGKKLTLST